MAVLQIDTIHVVARSPYLVLFSRLGGFPPVWLDELLASGTLFETWAHEACFAVSADWPLLRSHLEDKHHHWAVRAAHRCRAQDSAGMDAILKRLRECGPLRARDAGLRDKAEAGGWWAWSADKRRLEAWFALGAVMVCRRERFQRVYDLSERVLAAAGIDPAQASRPDAVATRAALIERSVHALGIARSDWLADYFRLGGRVEIDELDTLVEAGRLIAVPVTGWDRLGYVHVGHRHLLDRAAAGHLRASHTTVLSPFDPVVWDRERALALFGFDYRLECYTPAVRRSFGYFALPILHRDRLIGRVDAKMHRRDGVFEIKRLELDESAATNPATVAAVAMALARCAHWHEARRVVLRRLAPRALSGVLPRACRDAMARGS